MSDVNVTIQHTKALSAKGKRHRRLGFPLLTFLFAILSLLFIPQENAYAKNETVYTYTSGYCTMNVFLDEVPTSNYTLNVTYWGDMDGVGDYAWLKYTGEMYVMVNDGMAWLKEDLILNSGQDVIIQNGSGWGWTDSDGAEGLPFNTRQYAWWFPMKTSLRGYHLDKVTLGEGAFQAMTVAWGDDRFWLISDTNGLGITNYADGKWRNNSYDVYLAVNHYDVKYDGNGATGGSTADSKCTYNTPFNISECGYTKDHYIFAGWKDADGKSYSPGQVVSNLAGAGLNNDSITLYAQWIPANYNQTLHWYYYYAGGSYDSPGHAWGYLGDKVYSQTYGTWFDAVSKWNDWGNVAGYHYWCMNSNGWTVTGEGETNAHYYPNKYRVNVNVNGGSGTNGNFDMEYGTFINLGTPTRTGWKFTGWTITYNNSTNSTLSGNQFVMGYSNTYPYQDYMAEPSVKIIANWQDVTAPNASDTILTATNPAKTTVYATVTGKSPVAETPWVNNNVLLTFSSRDYESGLSELGIFEKITSGWNAVVTKKLSGETSVQTTSYTDSAEGSKIYYGKATDNAHATSGNPANKTASTAQLTVHIDKTAPTCTDFYSGKGTLGNGLTSNEPVVDAEADTGVITDVGELKSSVTAQIDDRKNGSTDVSGIKKVTLVVYDSDYLTQTSEDIYNSIYRQGTNKNSLISAMKYKEYDMSVKDSTVQKNGAGAVYSAFYTSNANWYEDFKGSANLKYFIVALDNAGNENMVYKTDESVLNISIYAYITRDAKDLDDGTNNFLCGDAGTLHIVTYGYCDELDIDFPAAMLKGALLDVERGQTAHNLGTTQKDNSEAVENAMLDPVITLTGDCQRNYDYKFIIPLYLSDESIGFLTKASTWTAENPVYDLTPIVTYETGYKTTSSQTGAQAKAMAEASATCYVGTNDSGDTKITNQFHTHIIAPDD